MNLNFLLDNTLHFNVEHHLNQVNLKEQTAEVEIILNGFDFNNNNRPNTTKGNQVLAEFILKTFK